MVRFGLKSLQETRESSVGENVKSLCKDSSVFLDRPSAIGACSVAGSGSGPGSRSSWAEFGESSLLSLSQLSSITELCGFSELESSNVAFGAPVVA